MEPFSAMSRLFSLSNRYLNKYSNILFKNILNTPPMITNPKSSTILYTPLSNTYCRAYILAAKSLLRFHSDLQVIIQDDGSLTSISAKEIQKHIVGAHIVPNDEMDQLIHNRFSELFRICPNLSSYKSKTNLKIMVLKLLNVLARFDDHKVFLMDSDILFLKRPDYIIRWLTNEYQHDIYTGGGMIISNRFIQLGFPFKSVSVNNFNSGILGVKPKYDQGQLIRIFDHIMTNDKGLFHEWEIEQALWAVILGDKVSVVNLDDLEELYVGGAHRTYSELSEKAIVAHFVGAIRFHQLKYLRLGYGIINDMMNWLPNAIH